MGTQNVLNRTFLALMVGLLGLLSFQSGCTSSDTPPEPDLGANTNAQNDPAISIPFRLDGDLTISRNGVVYQQIEIEIAEDDSSRSRGLMQRDSLPQNSGMLFLFPVEREQSFWMANTRIALDLVFIRSDGTIQSISKYVQPMNLNPVESDGFAQYVLEVPAGYSDTIGILEGDLVEWTRR